MSEAPSFGGQTDKAPSPGVEPPVDVLDGKLGASCSAAKCRLRGRFINLVCGEVSPGVVNSRVGKRENARTCAGVLDKTCRCALKMASEAPARSSMLPDNYCTYSHLHCCEGGNYLISWCLSDLRLLFWRHCHFWARLALYSHRPAHRANVFTR